MIDSAKNKEKYANSILERLDSEPNNHELRRLAAKDRCEALQARRAEESLIRQKSRVKWLKEGDLNTKFFYSTLKQRRRNNKIRCLEIDGIRCEEESVLKLYITDFYKNLFNQACQGGTRSGSFPESLV